MYIKEPLFAANDDCRRKQCSRTWSFNWWKQKQVKFDLFNVSKTNDADLSCCSCFFWFSLVFGYPRYTGLLTDLLARGAGEISHLLTLATEMWNSPLCPGARRAVVSIDWCIKNTNTMSRENQLIYIMNAWRENNFQKVNGHDCSYKGYIMRDRSPG